MFATFAIGVGTLGGAFVVSRVMYVRALQRLSEESRMRLRVIFSRIRIIDTFPVLLLVSYFVVRSIFPDYRLLVIFISWAAYNVYLLWRARWLTKTFTQAQLPLDFQIRYSFSKTIMYSGIVSSLLVLYIGGHL